MNLNETCSCGATFEVDADCGDAQGAAMGWRATHRHEVEVSEDVEEGRKHDETTRLRARNGPLAAEQAESGRGHVRT